VLAGGLFLAGWYAGRSPGRDRATLPGVNPAGLSALPTAASRTPLRVASVGLVARDLGRLTEFYQRALRLTVLEPTARHAPLGTAGGVTLLEIEQRPNALPDDRSTPGLAHTGFLMPTRQDHARWILHVRRQRIPTTGAFDHGVRESVSLDDPEGNGLEVSSDRP